MKATLDPRSFTIATFALCGFANFSSIGIQIGGIGALAPNRRHDLARLGLRAMFAGTLANFMHTGRFISALVSATNLMNLIPATAPAVGTGFDSSAGATLDLQATWSNATAGNTITLHQYLLESLV